MTEKEIMESGKTAKLHSWGLSMYGGYYADFWIETDGEERFTGLHGETLKELRRKLSVIGISKLESWRRWDN